MLKQEQIGLRQFSILVFMFTIGTAVIIAPHLATESAKQDGWISAILGIVLGLTLIWVYACFGKYFMKKSLVQLTQLTLGKWLGSVISLCFVAFLVILSSLVLTNMGFFITSRILVGTPIMAVEYMFIGLAIVGARLGLEVLARATELLLPLFLFLFLVFTLGLLPQIDIDNVKPVLEHGWYSILKSSVGFTIFSFGELVVFLMIMPLVKKAEQDPFAKMKHSYLSGTFLGAIVILILVLLAIFILGPQSIVSNTYPAYTLAKKIDIAGVFQRVEVLMAGIWFLSIFVKLTVLLVVISTSLKQIFRLNNDDILVIPTGLATVPLSLWLVPNVTTYITGVNHWMGILTLIFMFYPILIVTTTWLRMRFTLAKHRS